MRCENVRAYLADYLAETLRGDLADQVRAHVQDCRHCRAEIDALDETWDLLGTLPADTPDSAAMRRRFAATLDGYRTGLGHDGDRRRRMALAAVWSVPVRWMAAAALLVIGVAIGRELPRVSGAGPELD